MSTYATILATHFLELPLARQMEVAVALGLDAPDPLASAPTIFHEIVEHVKSLGKVDALWTEVESRHPAGRVDPNPYAQDKAAADSAA